MGGLVALILAGCGEGVVGPDAEITSEAAEAVAMFLVDVDGTAGWSEAVVNDEVVGTREFSRSAPCPAGGERRVTGSGSSSLDRETRVLSTRWATTLTHDQCAFERARRAKTVTTIIDGSVTAAGSATYQLPDERRQPRSLLSYEASRVGLVTTTVGDRVRVCEIDVKEVYDARSGTFRVTGTACGRTVDITRTRGARRDGVAQ